MKPSGIITLITDFGESDAYVGAMKGAILSVNPNAILVDICHMVAPQNVREAAFILANSYPYFPEGTIHLAIVDPGVGTDRRAVLLVTPTAYLLAPDNGVLSYVLARELSSLGPKVGASPDSLVDVGLDPSLTAYELSNPRYFRPTVSNTFHGRDIYAPVAGHISLGVPPMEFGTQLPSLSSYPVSNPIPGENGALVGHIVHVDRFGNLITDVEASQVEGSTVTVQIKERVINGLSPSYAHGGELLAIIGSAGYLEIAARNASAADLLGAGVGDTVRLRRITPQASLP